MRAGIVCPYSLRWPGGVQTHVLALAAALKTEGIDADVLAPTDGAFEDGPLSGVDVRVVSIGRTIPMPANGSTARIPLGPVSTARLLRAARDYDVLHVHEPLVPGAVLALTTWAPRPVVGTFHAASDGYWGYAVGRPALTPAWNRLTARTAVSEAAAQRVGRYFKGDVEILPNGVDFERFSRGRAVPERGGVPGPVVLFVGRDEPRKGLPVLLEAFEQVREAVPRATLFLAGPGTEVYHGPGITSFGEVDDERLAALYRSADVFCAPALGGESFGVVLLEAMAAGAAIVASDIPGYAAVARADAQALLVPPGDAVRLGWALSNVLHDGRLRRRLAAAGRRRAQELDWKVLSTKVAALYRRAAGPEREPGAS